VIRPEFEVASIKPNKVDQDTPRSPISCSAGGRFTASNVPAQFLIGWAYDIRNDFPVPAWASPLGERYNIEAKAGAPIGPAECRAMVQRLLRDRFQLKLHTEQRETNVYFLRVAKGGSKLREVKADSPPAASDGIFIHGQKIGTRAFEAWKIASTLGSFPNVGRPVVDRTGLNGLYQFSLDFSYDGSPDIFEAVQEQLGLRLEPGKAPIRFVVIDHLEKPSAN
jgi:uncharacterized protein (TIGR03435 family)